MLLSKIRGSEVDDIRLHDVRLTAKIMKKRFGVTGNAEYCRDRDKMHQWSDKWSVKFNVGKWKVMRMGPSVNKLRCYNHSSEIRLQEFMQQKRARS